MSGRGGRALPTGYYQLTVVAAFLATGATVGLRAAPGLPTVSLLEMVVGPTFLCLIAEILWRPRLRARALLLHRANRALVWYVGYAALASFVGLARAGDTFHAFHDLFVAFALYALVGLTVDDAARMRGLLAAVLAGAMVNVGFALLQISTGGPYPVPVSDNITAKVDLSGATAGNLATGLLNHPNGLAMFLLPIVLFLGVAAWTGFRASRRRRPVMAMLFVPTLVVFGMTYAKGAYAWLTAGACLLVLPRSLDRVRVWLAVAVTVTGIVALTWFSLDAYLEGDSALSTIVSRIELWGAAVEILRSDSFVAAFGGGGPQLAGRAITFEYTNAHNAWLDQGLTYGVPALVLYLGAYLAALRSLARAIRCEPHPTRAIALATFASLVAILGESFFEPTNHGVLLQAQLFLLLGIAATTPAPRSEAGYGAASTSR